MSGDDGISEEGPEERGDNARVYCSEDDESGGALLEERAGGDELEGKCDEVYDEEGAKFNPA